MNIEDGDNFDFVNSDGRENEEYDKEAFEDEESEIL